MITHSTPPDLTETQLEELIGQRLKQHRLHRNLNQTELARRAGLARRTITSVENGNGCTLSTLIRLLRALNIEHALDELLKPLPLSPNAIRQAQILAKPTRKHASKPRKKPPETTDWVWGDEKP